MECDMKKHKKPLFASTTKTPLGYMRALSDDKGLLSLEWQQDGFEKVKEAQGENDVSLETIRQLKDYLGGTVTSFTIPISDDAASPALCSWLAAIASIPYGQTVSYKALAALWGNEKASRAAGSACQKNPLPIIIPCHRIIGSDGSYDKYSGGDITAPTSAGNVARKKALLDLEAGLIPHIS